MSVVARCEVVGATRHQWALAGLSNSGALSGFPGVDILRHQVRRRVVSANGLVGMLVYVQKDGGQRYPAVLSRIGSCRGGVVPQSDAWLAGAGSAMTAQIG